jgi:hypothetical protein
MIFWLSGVRDQLSGRRRQCVELRDDEELAQFESSQHGTASKVDTASERLSLSGGGCDGTMALDGSMHLHAR